MTAEVLTLKETIEDLQIQHTFTNAELNKIHKALDCANQQRPLLGKALDQIHLGLYAISVLMLIQTAFLFILMIN